MIANGKKVAWTYQAGGVEFSQEGKILAFVAANTSAAEFLTEFDAEATSRQKKFSDTSSNDRYLVAVKNEHGIMNYYAPTVGVVDKQNPKAVKSSASMVADTAQGSNAPTPTMMEVKEGVKAGRTPAMNSEFTMGNTTMYRICGTDGKGGFIGYRLNGGNYRLKFLVSVAGYDWTYPSGVRKAYSGFCRAADSKGTVISELLSIPECTKFASSVESQLKAMGFKTATTDMMLTELLKSAPKSDTRRNVSAVFSSNKY